MRSTAAPKAVDRARPQRAREPDQGADQRDHRVTRQARIRPFQEEGETQHVRFQGVARAAPRRTRTATLKPCLPQRERGAARRAPSPPRRAYRPTRILPKTRRDSSRSSPCAKSDERVDGVDDRPDACRHLVEGLADIGERAAERARDPVLLLEQLHQIHRRRDAGGRPAGHETAAALEAEQGPVPGVGADMLEHHVDALALGQPPDLALEPLGPVVDDVIGAEFRRPCGPSRRRRPSCRPCSRSPWPCGSPRCRSPSRRHGPARSRRAPAGRCRTACAGRCRRRCPRRRHRCR